MKKTVYINLSDISEMQTEIMRFISLWVKEKKTPVPQREIILAMKIHGVKDFSVQNALSILLRKGYIRRAYSTSNRAIYVQVRTI